MAERTGLKKDSEKDMTGNEINTDDPEAIRKRIEETRGEMSETINAIEEKLSLENISEQVTEQVTEKASEMYETVKDTVYEATISKAGKFMKKASREINKSGIIEKVSGNPLPLFLISLGAGMLFFKSGKTENRIGDYSNNRQRNLSANNSNDSTIKNAGQKISGAASSAYDTVANTADSVSETVSDVAGNTVDTIGQYGSKARDQYDYYISENPLAVGAVALAAGALVGLAIPATEYEDRMMGETRENLISKATDKASETVDKVKDIAANTLSSVGEDAVEKAKKVAENAVDTVGDEARDKDLIKK